MTTPAENKTRPRPMVLVILDGWGYRTDPEFNAIAAADTPNWDRLWSACPHGLIQASEESVGLPADQMGNSEVGHLNLGAGRIVYQEFSRISRAIKSGDFYSNPTLTDAADLARVSGRALHVLGLLSPGGVHSHEEHIRAMIELAVSRGVDRVYLHAFLDGRDTPPRSAMASIERTQAFIDKLPGSRFASIIGRFFAMDRDHRWPRIQAAYDLITRGKAEFQAPDAATAVTQAYERGESDEFVKATAIVPPGTEPVRVADGDVMVVMNFRSDRARQITRAFIEHDFDGFKREVRPRLGRFVTLTEYQAEFNVPVAFPPERLPRVLGAYLAELGLHQLRVAETEKYAHVTFFFNGGIEAPYPGEDRVLVPSPTSVPTYNLMPEMSAEKVADTVVAGIEGDKYDLIVCNFANPDMVGHTGDMDATVRAIQTVDGCLGRISEAVRRAGGEMLITADHGNAEQLYDPAHGQVHTAHTVNPVPLVYQGRPAKLAPTGALQDIAPTLLHLMGLAIPKEMTGRPLVALDASDDRSGEARRAG